MEKKYFIQLLHKYFKGESTFEEDELIICYYNLFENEPDGLDLFNQEKKEEIKPVIKWKASKSLIGRAGISIIINFKDILMNFKKNIPIFPVFIFFMLA